MFPETEQALRSHRSPEWLRCWDSVFAEDKKVDRPDFAIRMSSTSFSELALSLVVMLTKVRLAFALTTGEWSSWPNCDYLPSPDNCSGE